jgi:hypothetical protein
MMTQKEKGSLMGDTITLTRICRDNPTQYAIISRPSLFYVNQVCCNVL